MNTNEVPRKEWPRFAIHPDYGRAKFDCPGDIPPGYKLEKPLKKSKKGEDE